MKEIEYLRIMNKHKDEVIDILEKAIISLGCNPYGRTFREKWYKNLSECPKEVK